jgi:hypothetical protein
MPNNVVRPLLAALSSDFLILTQEVPRSTDRNSTRTIYLWRLVFSICRDHCRNQIPRHVDLPKAYSVLLGRLYKTLYNIGLRFKIAFADTLTRLLHLIGKVFPIPWLVLIRANMTSRRRRPNSIIRNGKRRSKRSILELRR